MKFLYQTALTLLAAVATNTSFAQQVCNSNVEVTTPNSRFELNAGEATDTKTGLIWKRCLSGKTWNSATNTCDGSTIRVDWKEAMEAASGNWRVPNVKELGSIVEHSCANPSLNLSVFPGMPVAPSIWSSTPSRRFLSQVSDRFVWSVYYQDGTIGNSLKLGFPQYVLLVRDGV